MHVWNWTPCRYIHVLSPLFLGRAIWIQEWSCSDKLGYLYGILKAGLHSETKSDLMVMSFCFFPFPECFFGRFKNWIQSECGYRWKFASPSPHPDSLRHCEVVVLLSKPQPTHSDLSFDSRGPSNGPNGFERMQLFVAASVQSYSSTAYCFGKQGALGCIPLWCCSLIYTGCAENPSSIDVSKQLCSQLLGKGGDGKC